MKPYIFSIDKPKGMSSFDVIRHFKRHLPFTTKKMKIGHFGTLDPFASGLLLVGVGGALRLNDYIHQSYPKSYLATGLLGIKTDTGDATGTMVEKIEEKDKRRLEELSQSEEGRSIVEECLRKEFLGKYLQSPPSYSAAKFEGRALYKWAREGVEIKKEKVLREVFQLDVVKFEYPILEIRVEVSSGTYIRTLFEECASQLGTLGTLQDLRREKIGELQVESSLQQEKWPGKPNDQKWEDFSNSWNPENHQLPLDEVFPLKKIYLPYQNCLEFSQGKKIPLDYQIVQKNSEFDPSFSTNERIWIASPSGRLIGMGELRENDCVPVINFQYEKEVS